MSALLHDVEFVLKKLRWMRERRIWPNGLRYLWTDAFGVVLLVSLYRHLGIAPAAVELGKEALPTLSR